MTMNHLGGWYGFLFSCPIEVEILAMVFLYLNILYDIRDHFEGFGYNNSTASRTGDFFGWIVFTVIGIRNIKQITYAPAWMDAWIFHGIMPLIMATTGIVYQASIMKKNKETGTLADAYHNMIIVPIIVFSLITLSPIIWLFGSQWEILIAAGSIAIWVIMLTLDIKKGRLQNLEWLVGPGIKRFILRLDSKQLNPLIESITDGLNRRGYKSKITRL